MKRDTSDLSAFLCGIVASVVTLISRCVAECRSPSWSASEMTLGLRTPQLDNIWMSSPTLPNKGTRLWWFLECYLQPAGLNELSGVSNNKLKPLPTPDSTRFRILQDVIICHVTETWMVLISMSFLYVAWCFSSCLFPIVECWIIICYCYYTHKN